MSHLQEKGNFWSRVRSQTKNLTTQIGNLSIKSEDDGDTEESTLIHKALVKHYEVEGRGYPEWLGVPEEKRQHESHQLEQSKNPYNRNQVKSQAYRQNSQEFQGYQVTQNQATYEERFQLRRAATSFKEMYSNNTSESQDAQDNKGSLIKDRLKKNNYRNNFM